MGHDFPNRRAFLMTAGSAALSASLFPSAAKGANDKVSVAFIGVGRMGTTNLEYAAKTSGVAVAAVCDVYQPTLERAEAHARRLGFDGVKAKKDFREILADKSIDAVCIATPDHWHAYLTVEACKAGKDVYVEKPAFVYIDEGPKMVEAARKYQRVVQAGTMQRSGGYFQKAREIVKSGSLGGITFCRTHMVSLGKKEGIGKTPDAAPPAGLDWDLWLGPAPKRPFNFNRWGVAENRWSTFRNFWEYAGGNMTDWGAHLIDIVQWPFDEVMPLSVSAQGGRFLLEDNTETPDTLAVTYRYPGFVESHEFRTFNAFPLYEAANGTAFHGTEATLMVNRQGYTIYPNARGAQPEEHHEESMSEMNLPHWKNFLECIRTRAKPVSDIETCVRTTTSCVLANLSHRHGVTLDWDEKAFTVKQAAVKPALKAHYRAPWKLEV